MRYVLLAWQRENDGAAPAEDACGVCLQPWDALRAAGYLITMALLQSGDALLVCADGVTVVSASRERIAAVFVIEARDLNDALRIASRLAATSADGSLRWIVEVRSALEPTPGTSDASAS